jgi:hypothetical protein
LISLEGAPADHMLPASEHNAHALFCLFERIQGMTATFSVVSKTPNTNLDPQQPATQQAPSPVGHAFVNSS